MTGPAAPSLTRDIRGMVCFVIALIVLATAAGVAYVPLGLNVSAQVWRSGTAQVQSCTRTVLPPMYQCTATVEWTSTEAGDGATLQAGPDYQVMSRHELSGTVEVEGHPRRNTRQVIIGEAIIPVGQPARQSVLSTAAVFGAVVVGAIVVAVVTDRMWRRWDRRQQR